MKISEECRLSTQNARENVPYSPDSGRAEVPLVYTFLEQEKKSNDKKY